LVAGWFLVTPDPGSLALLPETWFRDCFHQTSLQLGVKLDLQPPLMSLSKSGNDLSFRGPLFCHSDCLCPDIQITSISFRLFVPTFRLYLSCHSYCLHCCHSHSLSQHSYSLYLLVQMISILSYRVYPSQGPVKCLRSAFNPKVATTKKN